MTRALLVPAGELDPVRVADIGRPSQHLARLQELVGGYIEHAQWDYEADAFLDDEGRLKGRAVNVRATHHIRTQSDAAKQGKFHDGDGYFVVGNVVFTGLADSRGNATDVPDGLVEAFGLTVDRSAGLV